MYQTDSDFYFLGTYVHTFLSSDENFFGLNKLHFPEAMLRAHLYTIFDSMCALRGLGYKGSPALYQKIRLLLYSGIS